MGTSPSWVPASVSSLLPGFGPSGFETPILDALPASIAVLDPHGSVLFVNQAWSAFSGANGGLEGEAAIGANFVEAGFWASDEDAPCDDIARACAGIRAVLNGTIDSFVLDYQCHTPIQEHWLELRVAPLAMATGIGAVLLQISITDRKRSADRAWRRANFDALTDLPNQSLLRDRLTQAIALARRQGGGGAVLVVDIDHLREINRLYGHESGDEVLQQVAERLRGNVRDSDSVARIGDDEFAVLAPRLGQADALGTLKDKLDGALAAPYRWAGGQLRARAHIAVAVFPGAGETASEVLEAAAEALVKSKRDADNR